MLWFERDVERIFEYSVSAQTQHEISKKGQQSEKNTTTFQDKAKQNTTQFQ